jgi:predicted RNase H-like HicB family nuclease
MQMIKLRETRGGQNFPGIMPEWKVATPPKSLGYCFDARIVEDETGGYVVSVAQLPGVVSEGDDIAEAIRNLVEAFHATIETYLAENMPIPWIEAPPKQPGEEFFRVAVNV